MEIPEVVDTRPVRSPAHGDHPMVTRPATDERGRMTAAARRADTGAGCELQVRARADGSWALHSPDSPVVLLDQAVVVYLARGILARVPTGSIRWAFSPAAGLVSHAVDESRHPRHVMTAECGARLMGVGLLYDRPTGVVCPDCAELQVARALPAPPDPEGRASGSS